MNEWRVLARQIEAFELDAFHFNEAESEFDIAIGIVGSLIGSWLLPRIGPHWRWPVSATIVATIGAVVLLLIIGLIKGGFPRRRYWRQHSWRL